jgi:hypothetical protein
MGMVDVVTAGSQRSPKTGIRFAFRCSACGLNQEAHTRRGIYAHCRNCRTINPGPGASGDPVPVAPRGRPRKYPRLVVDLPGAPLVAAARQHQATSAVFTR